MALVGRGVPLIQLDLRRLEGGVEVAHAIDGRPLLPSLGGAALASAAKSNFPGTRA